jgi:hypothetical protein
VAALFTKFDPRAFLDAERHAADGGRSAKPATLATLAALAVPEPNSENRPTRDALTRDAIVTDDLSFRNVQVPDSPPKPAKPAKPAKDEQRISPSLAKSLDAGRAGAIGGRADWGAEDWRARFDERAGFLEHDGGLVRAKAEVQAFECCIVEWLNRNPSFPLAGRCAWCGKPETPSAVVVPFGTEPGTHAWLHVECWPAWHKSRRAEAAMALRRMGIAPGDSLGDHDD